MPLCCFSSAPLHQSPLPTTNHPSPAGAQLCAGVRRDGLRARGARGAAGRGALRHLLLLPLPFLTAGGASRLLRGWLTQRYVSQSGSISEAPPRSAPPPPQASPLLQGIAALPAQHQAICLRMATAGLAHLQQPYTLTPETAAEFLQQHPGLASPADQAVLLRHGLKLLLYQPHFTTRSKPPPTPLAQVRLGCAAGLWTGCGLMPCAAQAGGGRRAPAAASRSEPAAAPRRPQAQAQAAPAAAAEPGGPPAPPGLCAADVSELEQKGRPAADVLVKRKLGLLHALAGAGVAADSVLLHYLAASVDSNEAVARWGGGWGWGGRSQGGLDGPGSCCCPWHSCRTAGAAARRCCRAPAGAPSVQPASREAAAPAHQSSTTQPSTTSPPPCPAGAARSW
jgi:hypothetical protein